MKNSLYCLELNINSFSYGEKELFKNFSLELFPSNIYLLKGNNGEGKTTLFSLLSGKMKFDGNIKINGEIIKQRDYDSFFSQVSYITQDVLIFENKTILENLLLPYNERNKKKAYEVLKKVNLIAYIDQKADCLSKGQRQLLSFARLLYKPKKIILLDEITTFLDKENQQILLDILLEIKDEHIILMISHEKYDEKFLSNAKELILENHQIKYNNNNTLKKEKEISFDYRKNTLFKDILNDLKFNKFLYPILFIFLSLMIFLTSSSIIIADSFYTNNSSKAHIYQLYYQEFMNTTSAVLVNNEVKISDFEEDKTYPYIDFIYSIDYQNKVGYYLNGMCILNDKNISNLNILRGNIPIRENEIIISDICYQVLKEKLNSEIEFKDDNAFEEYIFNDYYISSNWSEYKIKGVYQSKEYDEYEKRYFNENIERYESDIKSCYAFKVETVFVYKDSFNDDSYLIENTSVTKERMKFSYVENYMLSAFDSEDGVFIPILVDNKYYFLSKYEPFLEIFAMLGYVFLIGLIIYCLFIPFIYYLKNKRNTIYLRYLEETYKQQKRKHIITLNLFYVISFILGLLFHYLYIYLFNSYLKKHVFSLNHIFKINGYFYLFIALSLLFFIVYNTFIILKLLVKKDIREDLEEVKNK